LKVDVIKCTKIYFFGEGKICINLFCVGVWEVKIDAHIYTVNIAVDAFACWIVRKEACGACIGACAIVKVVCWITAEAWPRIACTCSTLAEAWEANIWPKSVIIISIGIIRTCFVASCE
jgi:hypothetical protein